MYVRLVRFGCANETRTEPPLLDAYRETQYSSILIEKMKQRHRQIRPEMECTRAKST